MRWNWQQPDWPAFSYASDALEPLERRFLLAAGELIGAFRHVGRDDHDQLRVELIVDEALKTSEIEGEILDRDSVQSSLRRHFGLSVDDRKAMPREQGIAEMMGDLYSGFDRTLSHDLLFSWHTMIMAGDRRISAIGSYRTHQDAMQVVSGSIGRPKVHFEAPPSARVADEMERYIDWFNRSAPDGPKPLPALTRAGLAHLHFESIHPFEDGNGRIGRALSEKALAQCLGQPSLIALAYTIERHRKRYYEMLELSNKENEVTDWLIWFAETILEAQALSLKRVDFHIAKARFYETFRGRLNERQQKAIARMFREGIDGFKGGLSAENYMTMTGASSATTTRDLQTLVEVGALTRTGERRYTRYFLSLN